MSSGKGPLRFRRTMRHERVNTMVWHRAARDTAKGEYRQLVAICGYTVAPSIALFLGYDLSTAVTPRHGELCEKCEKVAKDEAAYAERHPKEGTNEH